MAEVEGVWTLTSATLTSLLTTITSNIGVILPVALTLFGIMFSISFLPKLLKRFGN